MLQNGINTAELTLELWRYLRKVGIRDDAIPDAIQSAFVQAIECTDKVGPGWIARAAKWSAIKAYHRSTMVREMSPEYEPADRNVEPLERMARDEILTSREMQQYHKEEDRRARYRAAQAIRLRWLG